MPKTSRPEAEVVSTAAPWPDRTLKAHAAGGERVHGLDEVGEAAPEPVEPPHDEHVVLSDGLEAGREAGPVVELPRGLVLVDRVGTDPRL